jgi:adenosylcobinamide-phosphate synthase
MSCAAAMLVAMLLDAAIGWPAWLFERIGHPVTWIGKLILALDRRLNREEFSPIKRRALGVVASLLVIAVAALVASAVVAAAPSGWIGLLLLGIAAWPLIAVRSMREHVEAVARPLETGQLAEARHALSMIVGRDLSALDEGGIARAAIESLAENTSDGVVAPIFWGVVLGLPGIAAYKAINTLDSMIGHRTPRHERFGWAAARIDDAANLIPARLTAVLFALVSRNPAVALRCARADAKKHRSPNAGWPEAAMAGALDIRLSGPRSYNGKLSAEPWVNEGGREPSGADIRSALDVYRRAMLALAALLVLLVVWGTYRTG